MWTFEEFLKKLCHDENGELKAATIAGAVLFVIVITLVGMIVIDELHSATENIDNVELISSAAENNQGVNRGPIEIITLILFSIFGLYLLYRVIGWLRWKIR